MNSLFTSTARLILKTVGSLGVVTGGVSGLEVLDTKG